jgi:hypothetical protein
MMTYWKVWKHKEKKKLIIIGSAQQCGAQIMFPKSKLTNF